MVHETVAILEQGEGGRFYYQPQPLPFPGEAHCIPTQGPPWRRVHPSLAGKYCHTHGVDTTHGDRRTHLELPQVAQRVGDGHALHAADAALQLRPARVGELEELPARIGEDAVEDRHAAELADLGGQGGHGAPCHVREHAGHAVSQ